MYLETDHIIAGMIILGALTFFLGWLFGFAAGVNDESVD